MHRSSIAIIVLFALILSTSVFAQVDPVSVTKLPSGMRVIVREGHTINLVAVDVWVRAGSVNETAANNGVSHFLEHMVFKATSKFGPGQIDREMEGVGGELNGGTSKDYVHFYTTVESRYLPTALGVIADAVMNAQFRPEDIEKERTVVLDEIARAYSDPVLVATAAFSRAAFSTHPYGFPATGTKDSLNKLTRDDLVKYYESYFTPSNTTVVIAGDVSGGQAVAEVERAFAGFDTLRKGNTPNPTPPAEPARNTPVAQKFYWPSPQACVVLGFPVSGASEFRDVCALDTMLALLGDTYRGRISSALTSSGARFSKVVTDFLVQRYPTYFYVVVLCEPKEKDKTVAVLLHEFRKLALEPVAPGELSQAKARVEGSDLYLQETFSGQARTLGLYDCIASHGNALTYGPTVRGLKATDITAVALKYFARENYCLLTIEPKPESTATAAGGASK